MNADKAVLVPVPGRPGEYSIPALGRIIVLREWTPLLHRTGRGPLSAPWDFECKWGKIPALHEWVVTGLWIEPNPEWVPAGHAARRAADRGFGDVRLRLGMHTPFACRAILLMDLWARALGTVRGLGLSALCCPRCGAPMHEGWKDGDACPYCAVKVERQDGGAPLAPSALFALQVVIDDKADVRLEFPGWTAQGEPLVLLTGWKCDPPGI